MKSIVIRVLVNGVALWVADLLLGGVRFGKGGDGLSSQLVTILWVAVIFGLVNAVIKPVLKFFATPAIILTLGLFSLVVNAFMLELTSWFADQFNLAFHVQNFFWDAILGSIIITVISMILNQVLPDRSR